MLKIGSKRKRTMEELRTAAQADDYQKDEADRTRKQLRLSEE